MNFHHDVLFVLGAGASKPYGFPTGDELIFDIQNSCLGKRGYIFRNLEAYFHFRDIEKFGTELRDSNQVSIDSFLKNRHEFSDIGKIAITAAIVECEKKHEFYPRNQNWIKYLVNNVIGTDPNDWLEAKLNFITFNYDRSLEHILFRTIQSSFGLNDNGAMKLLSRFNIHHFYGSIGKLPSFASKNEFCIPMSINDEAREKVCISKGRENIKVMWEERNSGLSVQPDLELKNYFYRSKKIFILGFGFDEYNLKRLDVEWQMLDAQIYASSYNQSEIERERIIGRLEKRIEFVEGDCLELLKQRLEKL